MAGSSELIEAAKKGSVRDIARLAERGADVNGFVGRDTALIWAANNGHAEAVKCLLDHGAEIDKRTEDGQWTPLMVAAVMGHPQVVELLLGCGANPDVRDHEGHHIVDLATTRGQPAIAQRLHASIRPDPREIIYRHPVADLVMQEVYNFPLLERITLLRKYDGGPVEAMQREAFADLRDRRRLREAFAEHVKRGGKTPEEDVFPGVISKPRSPGLKL